MTLPEFDPDQQGLRDATRLVSAESGQVDPELLDIAASDRERSAEDDAALARAKQARSDTFYSDLIFTLASIREPEPKARTLWKRLLRHKWEMSESIGRNIGIRVAALDYFVNVLGVLDHAKILDNSQYIETAALAITDGLTGVFNHRYFQERLGRDLALAAEQDAEVSLLMFDIDHFKRYNDINGHVAGDVALREVARVMRDSVKEKDLVARYGGEEFAMILFGVPKHDAVRIAERVRRTIEGVEFPNESVLPAGHLTVSGGVASFPGDAMGREQLIRSADEALYAAKSAGRNCVCGLSGERRVDVRHDVETELLLARASASGGEEKWEPAWTINLSIRGAAVRTGARHRVGERLRLRVPLPGDAGPLDLSGRVSWYRETGANIGGNGDGVMGIRFEPPDSLPPAVIDRLVGKKC